MKSILLVASQHGDEIIGQQLYQYIEKHAADIYAHITFIIANPLAYSLGKRYVETDMNRSYISSAPQSYEEYLAGGLLRHIERSEYDLVLDLHTTHCVQEPSLLVAPLYDMRAKAFVAASSIKNVVIIDHQIVQTSLIGRVRHAVSLEFQHEADETDLANITDDIGRFIAARQSDVKHDMYRIYDLIEKNSIPEDEAQRLRNFVMSEQGFYPVLVGNNSYRKNTHYLGFKAERLSGDVRTHESMQIGYNDTND